MDYLNCDEFAGETSIQTGYDNGLDNFDRIIFYFSVIELLPVISNNLFPSFREYFDSAPVEIFFFIEIRCEEIPHIADVAETFAIQIMLHRTKQVVIGWAISGLYGG
mgnify:CR=1 FL=1